MLQKIRTFLFLLLAEVFSRILSFLIIIYIARNLGVLELGYWSYSLALYSFFTILADLGLDIYGLVELSKKGSNPVELITNVLTIKFFLLVGSIFLVQYGLSSLIEEKVLILIILLLLSDFISSLTPKWFFQAKEELEYFALIRAFQSLSYFLLTWISFFSFQLSIYILALSYLLSNIFTALFFSKRVLKCFKLYAINFSRWKTIIKTSLILGGALFVTQIYGNLDKVMIATILGKKEVGLYEAGYKLYSLVLVIFGLIWSVFTKKIVETKKTIFSFLGALTFIGVLSSLILVVYSDIIIFNLYGKNFFQTIRLLPLFAFLIIVMIFSYGLSSLLALFGLEKQWLFIVSIAALTNSGLNFLFIPLYKVKGALIATIISEIMVALGSYMVLRKIL